MISVADNLACPNGLNKTRRWQNCGPSPARRGNLLKNMIGINALRDLLSRTSKPPHAYVILPSADEIQRPEQRGLLVICTHNKFLQNSVVVTA
jgi:hypothetical protein